MSGARLTGDVNDGGGDVEAYFCEVWANLGGELEEHADLFERIA